MVWLYLGAIVLANLVVTTYGPAASIVTAFLAIGLDLSARDRLHDAWHGKGLAWKMGALIVSGSAISYVLNREAGQIALASCAAFGLAAVADTMVYGLLGRWTWLLRVNGSNVVSAGVDSLVFPTLAFGGLLPLIILGQLAAKIGGGLLWSLVLRRK